MAVLNEDVNQIERFLNTGANDLIQVAVSSVLVGAVFFRRDQPCVRRPFRAARR